MTEKCFFTYKIHQCTSQKKNHLNLSRFPRKFTTSENSFFYRIRISSSLTYFIWFFPLFYDNESRFLYFHKRHQDNIKWASPASVHPFMTTSTYSNCFQIHFHDFLFAFFCSSLCFFHFISFSFLKNYSFFIGKSRFIFPMKEQQ